MNNETTFNRYERVVRRNLEMVGSTLHPEDLLDVQYYYNKNVPADEAAAFIEQEVYMSFSSL